LLEARHRYAAATAGPAVRRQHVVAAAAIVAQRFGRPVPEEHRARAFDVVQPCTRFAHLEYQMLRRILIAHFDGLRDGFDADQTAVRESLPCDAGTREGRALTGYLQRDRIQERFRI